MLGDSYSGLKMALARFENSKEALDTVNATPEGACMAIVRGFASRFVPVHSSAPPVTVLAGPHLLSFFSR